MKTILIHKAFPQFEKELLNQLDNRGVLRLYKKNEALVKMGQPINSVFIILHGCVKAYRENKEEKEFVIAYLKDAASFGVSISDNSPEASKISLMTMSAIEPTYVLLLSFADKDTIAGKFENWYKYILQTSMLYHEYYLELIDNIAFQNLDHRIAYFLLRLSKTKKKNIIQISHREIANGLNSSREAVSRLLKKMEGTGKIKLLHNMIEIINLQAL